LPHRLDALSNRELAVFSLIAAGNRLREMAKQLGVSRKTIDTHCERIKQKLGYANAEELKRGARELLGEGAISARRSPSESVQSRGRFRANHQMQR
jgi:DNA-binding CsgD family transcriptional regulator